MLSTSRTRNASPGNSPLSGRKSMDSRRDESHEEGQDEETPEPVLLIRLDEADALVHLRSMAVSSANETLRKRVESVVDMALTTVSSLSEMYSGNTTSVANGGVIRPVEKTPETGAHEVSPAATEGEDAAEESNEV